MRRSARGDQLDVGLIRTTLRIVHPYFRHVYWQRTVTVQSATAWQTMKTNLSPLQCIEQVRMRTHAIIFHGSLAWLRLPVYERLWTSWIGYLTNGHAGLDRKSNGLVENEHSDADPTLAAHVLCTQKVYSGKFININHQSPRWVCPEGNCDPTADQTSEAN